MASLITGATGFVGGALAETLVRQGTVVRALVRKTSNVDRLKELGVEIRYGALEDKVSLEHLLDGIDIVYNSAGLVTDWAPWSDYYDANVVGVQNLLEAAQKTDGLTRFVHISSSDVYGYPVQPCDESYPITDVGLPYNRSKGLGEQTIWRFYQDTRIPVTVIRPATIYGPRSLSIVVEIATLLQQRSMSLINGGHTSAGLLYIDNAVEGIIRAAVSPSTVGKAYNLRDESNESWEQFVNALVVGLGLKMPWINLSENLALKIGRVCEISAEVLHFRRRPLLTRHATYLLCRDQGYSIHQAQRDFAFRSTIGFDEGMKRTLAWLASREGRRAMSGKWTPTF